VVVAYDFSAPPANGGDWKWGSLKASPKITCWAKNDDQFASVRNIDTTVFPSGSTASLRWDVPDFATGGMGERADEWRISIDDYADQFGENSEFWIQWRTRMDATYATFGFSDRSGGDVPGSTTYKHILCGEGMQTGLSWVPNGSLYGFQGVGSSFNQNTIAYTHSDFEGEANLIAPFARDSTYPANYGWKNPSAYHGKPGYFPITTRGQDSSYYTDQNRGNESPHVAACQRQIGGLGYTDKSTCFQYPVDQWFTLMLHFILGPRGHGLSTLGDGYLNVPAVRLSANQILLTNDSYIEHFNPPAAAPKKIRIRGATTGTIDAIIATKGPGLTLNFTAAVDSASSGTLTAAAVNGSFGCYFSHGQFRTVTITNGTAVSWSPPLPAPTPCTTGQSAGGTTLNFTAGVDGATLGTLTASRADATFFGFTFANGDVRDVTVRNGTSATWTPALSALATTKGVLQQATLTLSGLTGTIANEPLLVDEYIHGFTNSTIEYWGAMPSGAMQLLHRKSGIVLRVGNYQNFEGQTATAKYGTFAWTTFMTSKSLTQRHPTGKVWIGQIIIRSGSVAPAPPL